MERSVTIKTTMSIDHYNQEVSQSVAITLKRVQGGDDYPLVLIVYEVKKCGA